MSENPESDREPVLDTQHELSASPEGAEAEELRQVKEERDALLDRLVRTQAEFENVRKGTAREQQEFRNFALADALKQLLPILDRFERAVRAPSPNLEEFRSGINYGSNGLIRGYVVNDLLPISEEPNVRIMKTKAMLCNIEPGRRPKGGAALAYLKQVKERAA